MQDECQNRDDIPKLSLSKIALYEKFFSLHNLSVDIDKPDCGCGSETAEEGGQEDGSVGTSRFSDAFDHNGYR